ncbi:hypothetical protein [Bacillus halotolerans]|uniref:hypothetical protein n=1 Tax=Bacillus halotolerans TaxID=260554 RepID=UPI00192B9B3F|nr:hypothetical protein [Bacillus halotolerans]MBL4966752.1 hypothetical protein [Bacillus halotolerans]MBL4970786.1 hypothetical protein [Bacillus halotolerans]
MEITKRGAAWEWLHSWWMLFIFMPFAITSFFAFLFIGIKVRNKKWIIYGIIYFFVFAFAFVLPNPPGLLIVLPLWAVTIIHGFKVRPLFLIQLDVYKDNVEARAFAEARSEAESKFHAPKQSIQDIHIRKER